MIEEGREKIYRLWEKTESEILKTRDKRLKINKIRKRILKFPLLGRMECKRRIYRDNITGRFHALLDERLGYRRRLQLSIEGEEIIKRLVDEGVSLRGIRLLLKEQQKIDISEATISRILNREQNKIIISEKFKVNQNLYFSSDEGFISLLINNKKIKVRGRVTGTTLGYKMIGNRKILTEKRCYISLHKQGEGINNKKYWEILFKAIKNDYLIDKSIKIYGATDNVLNMVNLVKIAKAEHIPSKFHQIRLLNELSTRERELRKKEYRKLEKRDIGYWSESDIAHILKGPLRQGNKTWNLQAYRNILERKGVRILNY